MILSDVDVVEPDLLFVSNERRDVLGKWIHGAPDLVVEILSPGTRRTDEITKRRLYERVGVREYWIVDGEIEVVKVYRRRDDGSFPREAELSREEGQSLTTPSHPTRAGGDVRRRGGDGGPPRAARAVGNIMRECRDTGVPCHRVVGAGGALGGYGGDRR